METGETFGAYADRVADEPVYVILGVQGSGTNLLSRILTRVFGFSVLRDRSMVFRLAAALGRSPSRSEVEQALGRLASRLFPSALDRKLRNDVIRRNEHFRGINEHFDPAAIQSGADFARFVYAYRAYSFGTERMAIKSDDLWEVIGSADVVLPERRVILLTRDFRDNLVSIAGKAFGPVEPVFAALYVKERFAHYHEEFRRAEDKGFHLKYEALLESPRAFVDDFADHFGLAPTTDPDAALATLRFRPNKVRRWAKLPPRDLAWCEAVLKGELETYGYELSSEAPREPTRVEWIAARARDVAYRMPQKVQRIALRLRS